MKAVKYSVIVLVSIFLFAACQKEFSLESGTSASGSLKDTAGNCLPVTINGTYRTDSALTDSNFVMVQVRFSAAGNYNIITDTANGFSFQASGSVKDTGLNFIKLTGIGKPRVAQLTNFFVAFDSSLCTFSIPVIAATGSSETAVYTLAGSPDNCSNANVQGDYEENTPLDSANLVSIQVNVDSIGTYAITAGPVNGMTFNAQGLFTSPGLQTITLQGSGTPAAAGATTVPLNAGGTLCSFAITVNSTSAPARDSGWQFSEGQNSYHGFVDSAYTQRVELENKDTGTVFSFYGFSSSGPDTLFRMDVLLPDSTIETGTYSTKSGSAQFELSNLDSTILPYYTANFKATPTADMKIEIKTYNALTKIVTGTFSGTAMNAAGVIVTINEGKFYAKIP